MPDPLHDASTGARSGSHEGASGDSATEAGQAAPRNAGPISRLARAWRWLRGNPGFLVVLGMMLVSGTLVLVLKGTDAAWHALGTSKLLFLTILPALGAGLLLSSFARELLPRERIARWMGEGSGVRGLALAAVGGLAMPGGPMAAFPMVLALGAAGADAGAITAFVLSWAMNGMQRILVWEVPLLGPEFAGLRFFVSLPLPILAGLVVRRLPFRIELPRP